MCCFPDSYVEEITLHVASMEENNASRISAGRAGRAGRQMQLERPTDGLECRSETDRTDSGQEDVSVSLRSSRMLRSTFRTRTRDGRLGSRLRGYHPVAPRLLSCRPFVHRL
jgi:hypothetical protein